MSKELDRFKEIIEARIAELEKRVLELETLKQRCSKLPEQARIGVGLSEFRQNLIREYVPLGSNIPPTLEEVQAYCKERKNSVDPQLFFDHNEARGWVPKGQTRMMKNWQAAVRTWEKYEKKFSPVTDELPDEIEGREYDQR